jgi:hypothetical protein
MVSAVQEVVCWRAGADAGAAGTWAAPSGSRERARSDARKLAVWAGVGRPEQARHRCKRRRHVSARARPERRRTARSKQWRAERIQTREWQRHAGQGRARFERAREQCGVAVSKMQLRCSTKC